MIRTRAASGRYADAVSQRSDETDALIVGAGIQGATLAWEMACRGLRATVIDGRTPGSGNTAASFGLLHGGLRYLQRLDVPRWLRSRREQHWFAATLPAFVQPLAVVMPLYAAALRSPALFRTAFALDALAARALQPDAAPSAGAVLQAERLLPDYPLVRGGMIGAARWNEFLLPDAPAAVDHLLARAGARVVHGEATALIVDRGRVAGLEVSGPRSVDRLPAPAVVVCAGGATRRLARRFHRDLPALSSAVLAFNLLLDLPAPRGVALGLSPVAGRGRGLFLRAEGEHLLAGTWYAPAPDGPGDEHADAPDPGILPVGRALDELRACLPGFDVRAGRVLAVRAGYLPAADAGGLRLRDRDVVVDHAALGGPTGLWSVLGVKLTTARAVSAVAVERIWPGASRAAAPVAERAARTGIG